MTQLSQWWCGIFYRITVIPFGDNCWDIWGNYPTFIDILTTFWNSPKVSIILQHFLTLIFRYLLPWMALSQYFGRWQIDIIFNANEPKRYQSIKTYYNPQNRSFTSCICFGWYNLAQTKFWQVTVIPAWCLAVIP